MSPEDIVEFLEGFREIQAHRQDPLSSKSKLISIKMPEDLLVVFRQKSKLEGVPYQTQIKNLMRDWIAVKAETT
jgi:predicted DNA binding CopG/RHH family protein